MPIHRDDQPQANNNATGTNQQPNQSTVTGEPTMQGQNQNQYVDPNAQQYNQQGQGQQAQPNYNAGYANFTGNNSYVNMQGNQSGLDRLQQMRSNYSRAVPVNDSAAVAYDIQKYFAELVEKTKVGFQFAILTPERHSVPLCAIVVHRSIRGRNGQEYAAAHSIIIEGPQPLNSRTAQYGNQQFNVLSVPGDIYSDRMYSRVVEELRAHYGSSIMVLDAQASVIPKELNLENNKNELTHILSCASDAVEGMLNLVSDSPRILTANVIRPDNTLRIVNQTDFNPAPQYTASGQPVRSDISVTLSATANANGFENEMAQMPLVTTDMYIDLLYVPQQPMQQGWFGAPAQQFQSTLSYIPRVVITSVQNQELFASLEEVLLGIVNSMSIVPNNAYTQVFRPRERKGNIDSRDIGAVGYEVPQLAADGKPGHIVLDGDQFKTAQLIADTIATNNVFYSMDIPEVGDTSWITNALIGAANGNPEAIAQVIQACNNLSNGEFAKIWDNSGIVDNDFTRIHLGHYFDGQIKKDLRTIDRLALLNVFSRTGRLDLVAEYDSTFIPDNSTTDLRLDKRFQILTAALGDGQINLKGYARRVTFRGRFLQLLELALKNAGVVIQQSNGNFNNTTVRRMTAQDYAMYSLGGQTPYQPGIFQWGGVGNFTNVMGPRFGNWGSGQYY